jgi:cyclase
MLDGFKDYLHTPPNTFITENKKIETGDLNVEIIYKGAGHTDSDLIVFIPSMKILITGDLMVGENYMPIIHNVKGGNLKNIIKIQGDLLKMKNVVEFVVPGHGDITTLSETGNQIDYLMKLQKEVNYYKNQGFSLDQAKKEIHFPEFNELLLYDLAHVSNIEAAW